MSVIARDKRFDKSEYELFDGPAKSVAIEWMTQLGFVKIEENLNEAKGNFKAIWDIRGYDFEGTEWRIEAEIKRRWGTEWTTKPFHYNTVDIPFRKREKTEQQATHMMVIGQDLERFFICKRETMLASKISEKYCRNVRAVEPFYNVSIDAPHTAFWFKNNGRWEIYTC